ncbi:MAG TPA: hypothetical protein VHV31_10570 [Nitrolancea sp.]|nr:hypothetical protein [Nitrolancea sp.]
MFRQLSPAMSNPARNRPWSAVYQPEKWLQVDLAPAWLGRRLRVPNLLLALALASTLGISATISAAVISQPVRPASITSVVPISAPEVSVPQAKTFPSLGAPSVSTADSTSYAQITTLQSQLQSMNSDLQGLQLQSDQLNNASHTQESDLASARTNLAGSEESLAGQTEDFNARRTAIQQDLQSRLAALNQSLTTADQAVSQVRSILGLPAAGTSVGGQ